MMPIVFSMKIRNFSKDTFESDTIFVTFEIFGKCSESVGFDAYNNLQEDLKFFKSDTFEKYKSVVSLDVHSLSSKVMRRLLEEL